MIDASVVPLSAIDSPGDVVRVAVCVLEIAVGLIGAVVILAAGMLMPILLDGLDKVDERLATTAIDEPFAVRGEEPVSRSAHPVPSVPTATAALGHEVVAIR
jgi:hypothetical protein